MESQTLVYSAYGNPLDPGGAASFPKAAEAVEVRVRQGALTLNDRRLYNTLLAIAYPRLLEAEEHSVAMIDIRGSETNNHKIKESVQRLQSTLIDYNYFKRGKRHWVSAQLLGECRMNEGDGILYFTFPSSVRQALYNPAVYARINLRFQQALSSKYALVLYELLQLRVNAQSVWTVKTEELMDLMDAGESLQRFSNFKQRALQPAVDDINANTNIRVEAVYHRKGTKIADIEFRLGLQQIATPAIIDATGRDTDGTIRRKSRVSGKKAPEEVTNDPWALLYWRLSKRLKELGRDTTNLMDLTWHARRTPFSAEEVEAIFDDEKCWSQPDPVAAAKRVMQQRAAALLKPAAAE